MRRSKLSCEALESRALMAASAVVSGGDLVVTGSASNDYVKVYETTPGSYTLENLYGTGGTTTFSGVTGSVWVNLGAGNDLLILGRDGGSITSLANININAGSNDDRMFLYSVTATGNLNVDGGLGRDRFYLKNAGIVGNASLIALDATYSGGTATNPTTGNHAVDLRDVMIGGNLSIVSVNSPVNPNGTQPSENVGRKKFNLRDTTIGGYAMIDLDSIGGDNWVRTYNTAFGNGLFVFTAGGNDRVDLLSTDVSGHDGQYRSIVVDTGAGNDRVAFAVVSASNQVHVSTGTGNDRVNVAALTASFAMFDGGLGNQDDLNVSSINCPYNMSGFEL